MTRPNDPGARPSSLSSPSSPSPPPSPSPQSPPQPQSPRQAQSPQQAVVGVLLPVRIETRFSPGRLRVRVIPDEPWFNRHDPRVSVGELDALRRYVDALAAATTDPVREVAWRELVAQAGGARAVYLIRVFVVAGPNGEPVVRDAGPDEIREEPAFPRIDGFPDQLDIWLARGGGIPESVLTLTVDRDRLLVDFPDPDEPTDRRWWEDWDEACAAGLAGEIELGGDPDDIDALFVTGLGDGDPAKLFAAHGDAGRLATIAPGTATNTVDGQPAAPLGNDPDTWWDVLHTPASDTERLVSASLTGDPGLLGNLAGPSEPHREPSAAIVAALWPALWGFAGADVWPSPGGSAPGGGGASPLALGTYDASGWAPHALFPEGPFPTLRVGPQPYGLLPATALADWVAAPEDPPVEAALRDPLLELREAYRAAAEARGTAVDATTDQLLDLIGQVPTSPLYRHRRAWPLELWWLVLLLLGYGVSWQDLDAAWINRHALAERLGLVPPAPARRYGTVGAPRRLGIPLVVPESLPADTTVAKLLCELVRLAFEGPHLFAEPEGLEREFLRCAPDSLLLRLAVRSLQVAIGDVGRLLVSPPEPAPRPPDLVRPAGTPSRLEVWIRATRSDALHDPTPEAARFRRVADGLLALAEILLETEGEPDRLDRFERLLRATVDTATVRIDPWLVGPPTRRLRDLVDSGAAAFRLGAYGWVDQPRPGSPGPTPAGLLHAPSPGQALTATVLRDRAVSDPADGRWDLDVTSRTVRDADRLAEHVRVGAHLAEAIGREVERVVADPADVTRLRRDFPIRTEHDGRRSCDGLAVLKALTAAPGPLGLDPDRLAELERLRAGLDSYGDLLVAEAVHHVVEGRAEVAGAVMDAAAGLARPPHLGLLRTPRQGRAVTTSVVIALPDAAAPAPTPPGDELAAAELSPAALADPAAAAFVTEQAGAAATWQFDVAPIDDGSGDGEETTTTVTLAAIGLEPADALALPWTDVARLAAVEGARTLGIEPNHVAVVGGDGLGRYERAARLVTLLGRNPAGPDAGTEQPDAVVDPAPVDADLLARYTQVRGTATALVGLLGEQLALAAPDGGIGAADEETLARLVVAARSWGIAPQVAPPAPGGPVLVGPALVDPAEQRLVATAARASALLGARVAAAPSTQPPAPGEPAPAARLARADLVEALTALVSPTGQLAVTGRLTRAALPAAIQPDASLDQDWLPTVAAVREPLAQVEVHQLAAGLPPDNGGPGGGGGALVGWSNKPGDPWQQTADNRRLVVVYAADGLDLTTIPAGDRVAVAAVDRFAEVIPVAEQTTGAAFGFDAPAARAPQAILLAVPPDLDAPIDDQTLVAIVAETRLLARARMARPVDLDPGTRGLLPAALLPAAGKLAVPLEPAAT